MAKKQKEKKKSSETIKVPKEKPKVAAVAEAKAGQDPRPLIAKAAAEKFDPHKLAGAPPAKECNAVVANRHFWIFRARPEFIEKWGRKKIAIPIPR